MDPLWDGLRSGASRIGPIAAFDASGFVCQQAAEVPADFTAKNYVPKPYRKAVKVMARDIEYAVAAAQEAARDARLVTKEIDDGEPTYPLTRLGCQIGAGLIACEMPEMALAMATADDGNGGVDIRAWGEQGMQNLTPLWLLKYLPNMLACHVTIVHGARGPSNTITCAEASGLLSLGEARSVIQRGRADACFAGSAEAKINAMGMIRLQLAQKLAHCGPDDQQVVQPYADGAAGTVLGDGGGLVVLEREDLAKERGVTPYARVIGFGASYSPGDTPQQFAQGLGDAMEIAIEEANLKPEDVDAILPMALGVPAIDRGELDALQKIFGEHLRTTPVVMLPKSIGHLCSGMGGVSLAVAARCLRDQQLPLGSAMVHAVSGNAQDSAPPDERPLDVLVVCNSSQGGQHAAVVMQRV
jgi:3-oxoacyl-[acyl-carrier-protein] synthase II